MAPGHLDTFFYPSCPAQSRAVVSAVTFVNSQCPDPCPPCKPQKEQNSVKWPQSSFDPLYWLQVLFFAVQVFLLFVKLIFHSIRRFFKMGDQQQQQSSAAAPAAHQASTASTGQLTPAKPGLVQRGLSAWGFTSQQASPSTGPRAPAAVGGGPQTDEEWAAFQRASAERDAKLKAYEEAAARERERADVAARRAAMEAELKALAEREAQLSGASSAAVAVPSAPALSSRPLPVPVAPAPAAATASSFQADFAAQLQQNMEGEDDEQERRRWGSLSPNGEGASKMAWHTPSTWPLESDPVACVTSVFRTWGASEMSPKHIKEPMDRLLQWAQLTKDTLHWTPTLGRLGDENMRLFRLSTQPKSVAKRKEVKEFLRKISYEGDPFGAAMAHDSSSSSSDSSSKKSKKSKKKKTAPAANNNSAQKKGTCNACGAQGHFVAECTDLDKQRAYLLKVFKEGKGRRPGQ